MTKQKELTGINKFIEDYNIDPILFIVSVIALIAVLLLPLFFVKSADAKIEGHTIDIPARVSGVVIQNYVTKDQEVKKGDVLFEINPQEYQQELAKAQDELEICKAKMSILTNQPYPVDQSQPTALVDNPTSQAMSRYKLGENSYSKYSKVYDNDQLKPKEVNHQQAEQLANTASQKSMQDVLKTNSKKSRETNIQEIGDLLSNPGKIDVSHDTVESVSNKMDVLESQIEELQLKLSFTRICAPKDGIISTINVDQGYYVGENENMCTIIPKSVWVTANFSQKNLNKIQVGQSVMMKIPGYRTRIFKGVVASIDKISVPQNPDQELEVTPGEPDNLQMEQPAMKQVTNVKIEFIEDYSDFNLMPGTNVIAIVKVK